MASDAVEKMAAQIQGAVMPEDEWDDLAYEEQETWRYTADAALASLSPSDHLAQALTREELAAGIDNAHGRPANSEAIASFAVKLSQALALHEEGQ